MKNILTVLFIIFCLQLQAQAPQRINYQGVARDNSGNIIPNQNISLKLSIIDGSPSGTVQYSELHLASTNTFGLFAVQIGAPTAVLSGTFAGVTWSAGDKYVKVEMDPNAGTNYVNMGTTQLASVPYALFAGSAPFVSDYPADTIGTVAHGGVVFYVDETGHHGLVCALDDQSTSAPWNNTGILSSPLGIDGDGQGAGEMNTTLIIAAQIPYSWPGNYAAKLCDRYISAGTNTSDSYGDWYLPSKWEFNMLLISTLTINDVLAANGTAISYFVDGAAYWTSTEIDATTAYSTSLTGPFVNTFVPSDKDTELLYVRAIRKF